jgi:carboxylate-amine ligase
MGDTDDMANQNGQGFHFGLESEYMLVEADTFRPLWHHDLSFERLSTMLESIPFDDLPPLDGLELELPHRKQMPFAVEGYHVPDPDLKPLDLLPKGIEIRTPVCSSIGECLGCLTKLYDRLQASLADLNYRAVSISHHPIETHFEGPQNKRRHDFWQWAMEAMVTYGPDVNVSLPTHLQARMDLNDLFAKVNYYAPALTALTLASPFHEGELWRIRGRLGKSIRTYRRSVIAPALEVHMEERGRLEFKPFEATNRLDDLHAYFLLWLALLLDEELDGRATNESRIYDLGQVAQWGVEAETVRSRASEVLRRAPRVLSRHGFCCDVLETFQVRLETGRLPADDLIELYERENSIPAVLRYLSALVPCSTHLAANT